MNEEAVIKIEGIKQQFGRVTVLEEINLSVKKGEILGMLGPSGSGKLPW
jgi:amino acid ABC transporter ATP-binding protein, PAAT family (TC 3.A.1.3.-)